MRAKGVQIVVACTHARDATSAVGLTNIGVALVEGERGLGFALGYERRTVSESSAVNGQ